MEGEKKWMYSATQNRQSHISQIINNFNLPQKQNNRFENFSIIVDQVHQPMFFFFLEATFSSSAQAFWKTKGAFLTMKKATTKIEQPVINHPHTEKTVWVALNKI